MLNPFGASVLVFLGAGLGANARYWLTVWAERRFESSLMATGAINVVGSLLMGVLLGISLKSELHAAWRPFVAAGLLGGFTTFSAFSVETLQLLQRGNYQAAALYTLGSVALSLLACAAGFLLSRAL